MNKIFILLGALAVVVAAIAFFPKGKREGDIRVGIVVPLQHAALDDIVKGFSEDLTAALPQKHIVIDVQNALGDINLQKAAINKFINEHVDLLVPVATGTTQMTLNLSPAEQPILFLAADIPPQSEIAIKKPGLMGVIDELGVEKQLNFIHAALPALKKLALIYSANDRIPRDADLLVKEANALNISVQKLMIQNLSELYTVAQRIENDAEAIFILKDNMVASGIKALLQQAERLKIPLVTSDEGTINLGGAFALGVIEADIGRQGAKIAATFFGTQTKPPIEYLTEISVFINEQACAKQNVVVSDVISAAEKYNYRVSKR